MKGLRNIAVGARLLARSPAFAVTAILILGLGVGVNTLVFSIADAAVLRPLPYAEPDRLVWVSQGVSAGKTEYALAPDFAAWRSEVRSFAQATAFSERFRNFAGRGEPVRILTAEVTHEFLPTLGAQPALGRDFLNEEDRPGGARVALLAYDFCARRFGSVQSCVGETVKLDGEPFEVVGVLPEHFRFPQPLDVDVLTPLALGPEQEERVASAETGVRQVKVIARLRPGATVEQARAELNAVQSGVVQSYPQLQDGRGVNVRTLHEHLTEGIAGAALFLMLAVGLLWALGCLNIGSLLFARTISRRAEMAVRVSIGAGRGSLFGQLLAENAVLAFCGCVASVFVTLWGHRLVTSILPWKVFAGAELELNARVALLITLSFVLTALLISVMSLWALPRHNIADILKSGGGSVIGSYRLRRVMNGVVVCELALAVVLLACAGLMVRSFWAMRYRDLGFRPERILTLRVDLSASAYPGRARQAAFFEELSRRIAALAGVESVGLCSSAPPTPVGGMFRLTVQGQRAASPLPLMARVQVVNSDFFRVLRVPFVEGRAFAERAQAGDAPEVVVNRALKDEYLTEGPAVGRKVRLGGPKSPWVMVVGVAEDFKNVGLGDAPEPEVYYPYQQFPSVEAMYLLVRSSAVEPLSLMPSVRREVWAIDREQPLAEVQTLDQRLTSAVAHPRFVMALLVGFAALALGLAALGVYGVMSYAGRLRAREIAIRLALGARHGQVTWMIVRECLALSLLGASLGVVGARTAGNFLASMLHGVSPSDPYTFMLVLALLISVAVLSSYLTARRAATVEPVEVLRHE